MKKIYISPGCDIMDVVLTNLMADSLHSNEIGDQTVTPDPNEPAPDEFTSRRRNNVWDDEEEEDIY